MYNVTGLVGFTKLTVMKLNIKFVLKYELLRPELIKFRFHHGKT